MTDRSEADKRYDKTRPSAAKRGYDRQWRKRTKDVLTKEPYCQRCKMRRSEHVHHSGGRLRALCAQCHGKLTRSNDV